MATEKAFGVSLILSQVDPFYCEKDEDWGDYALMGPFDGLRLEIAENPSYDFVKGSQPYLTEYSRTGKRMLFQAKVQRQFFSVDDDKNDTKKKSLLKYFDGTRHNFSQNGASTPSVGDEGKPFIALFSIKLHPQFTKYERGIDDIPSAIEDSFISYMLNKKSIPKEKNIDGNNIDLFECIVMSSFGIDDYLLFVGMDKPWYGEVMGFARELNCWACEFKSISSPAATHPGIKDAIKDLEQLKTQSSSWHEDVNPTFKPSDLWKARLKGKDVDIIRWLQRKAIKNPWVPPTSVEVSQLTCKLRQKFEAEIRNKNHDASKWLLDCINTIRFFGPVPVVLRTYSILGYSKSLYRQKNGDVYEHVKSDKLFDAVANPSKTNDADYDQIDWHYRITLRPGYTGKFTDEFKSLFTPGSEKIEEAMHNYETYIRDKGLSDEQERKAFPGSFSFDEIEDKLPMTIGRYDYTWQAKLSPTLFLYISTQILRRARVNEDTPTALMYIKESYSRLSLDNYVDSNSSIHHGHIREDMLLNRLWAAKQGAAVAPLFAFIDLYDNNGPFSDERLQQMITEKTPDNVKALIEKVKGNDRLKDFIARINRDSTLKEIFFRLSSLHVQGCLGFFHMASWHEFLDVRKFFVSFYKQITEIFLCDLLSDDYDGYGDAILHDTNRSMMIGMRSISAMLDDRFVVDMSTRENTRPSLYAAGAYEKIIRGYSNWIGDLTELLKKAETENAQENAYFISNDTEALSFTLMPVEDYSTHSHSLFPIRFHGAGRLIVYEMPLEDMLNFESVPTAYLAHECGHYWGNLNRPKRVWTWIGMVACLFSQSLSNTLRKRSYYSLPATVLTNATKALEKAFVEFLLEGIWPIRHVPFMHHIQDKCEQVFVSFISVEPDSHTRESGKSYCLIKALAQLYYEAGALPMLKEEGRFFNRVLRAAFTRASEISLLILRECYADMVAFCALDMSEQDAIDWLIKVFKARDESHDTLYHESDIEFRSTYLTRALQIISALFITSDATKITVANINNANNIVDINKIKEFGYIEAQTESHSKLDGYLDNGSLSTHKYLKEYLTMAIKGAYSSQVMDEYPEYMTWVYSAMYLFDSCLELRRHFPYRSDGVVPEPNVTALRNLHDYIKPEGKHEPILKIKKIGAYTNEKLFRH